MKNKILLILLFLSTSSYSEKIDIYHDVASDIATALNQLVLSDKKPEIDKQLNALKNKYPKLNTVIIFIQGPKYHEHYLSKYFNNKPSKLAKIQYLNPNIINVSTKADHILIDTQQNTNVYYRITLDK